jgi:hypothetical protein
LAIAIAAVLVAIAGVGRLTRAITYDDFPPSIWWRMRWATWTHDGPWTKLFTCYWCLSPWIMAVAIGWYLLGLLVLWIAIAWWLFWGWLALSYLAAILVNHDEQAD